MSIVQARFVGCGKELDAPPPAPGVLAEPIWLAVERYRGLQLHGIRGARTLCGLKVADCEWEQPPPGTGKCRECAAVPVGHATRHDFLPMITYRQLDYWTRRGVLRCDNQECGSGYRRTWPPLEYRIARLIHLLQGQDHTLQGAARKARKAAERETAHLNAGLVSVG